MSWDVEISDGCGECLFQTFEYASSGVGLIIFIKCLQRKEARQGMGRACARTSSSSCGRSTPAYSIKIRSLLTFPRSSIGNYFEYP